MALYALATTVRNTTAPLFDYSMQNKELEYSVLSHILSNKENILKIQERGIDESFFQIPQASKLLGIVLRFYPVYNVLPTAEEIELVLATSKYTHGLGDDYKKQIAVCFAEVSAMSNLPHFEFLLDSLVQYHKTNLFQKSLLDAEALLANKNTDQAIEVVKGSLYGIDSISAGNYDLNGNIEDNAAKLWEQFKDAEQHPEKYRGIKTGYREFDRLTMGLVKGTVTLISGWTGQAKSVLALNIAHNVALTGKRVLYHINEGTFELNQARLASCATGLNIGTLTEALRGERTLSKADRDKYEEYLTGDKYKTLRQNVIIDSIPPSVSNARYLSTKISQTGPDLVLVDHLTLMNTDNKKVQKLYEELGVITQELVTVTRERHVPMVVISHVSKEAMKKSEKNDTDYGSEDVGLSSQIPKNVDNSVSWRIQNVDQFEQTHQGIGILSINKSRNIRTGKVEVRVDTNIMKIEDIIYGGMGSPLP